MDPNEILEEILKHGTYFDKIWADREARSQIIEQADSVGSVCEVPPNIAPSKTEKKVRQRKKPQRKARTSSKTESASENKGSPIEPDRINSSKPGPDSTVLAMEPSPSPITQDGGIVQESCIADRNFAEEPHIYPGLTGIHNIGNSCYIASVIQCLSNVVEMRKRLLERRNSLKGISKELHYVFQKLWEGRHKHISLPDFYKEFCRNRENFRDNGQQDAHEFFTFLINDLHTELQRPVIGFGIIQNMGESKKEFLKSSENKQSMILDVFHGQIRHKYTCQICERDNLKYEQISSVMLGLPQNDSPTDLGECMETFLDNQTEIGLECGDCKNKQFVRRSEISIMPQTLVIMFNRFQVHSAGDLIRGTGPVTMPAVTKKTNFVKFPLNSLDMKRYMAFSGRDKAKRYYDLFAICNHIGTVESGHYTAFCRNDETNRWYKFDDDDVNPVETADVVTKDAYMLFYRLAAENNF